MKTIDEAKEMIAKIEKEIARLPAINFFGESNRDDIRELKGWVEELNDYVQTGTPPKPEKYEDVSCWIHELGFSNLEDL